MPFSRANAEMEMTVAAVYKRRHAFSGRSAVIDRRYRAFTLIELLVVIVIIAVLMGFAFPVFQSIQNQAKKTQAKNDVTQIVTAVNAFYTEYGKYPLPSGTTGDFIYGPGGSSSPPSNAELFYTLRGVSAGTMNLNNAANPRIIVFINPPYAKTPT